MLAGALVLAAALSACAGAAAEPVSSTSTAPGWSSALLRVPAGVVAVHVTAVGAAGGSGCAAGGRGARVSATLPVTPGEELRGEVGAVGEANMALREPLYPCAGGEGHGWYDGGAGSMGSGGLPGGGSAGGGASWVAAVPQGFPCCLNMRPWAQGRLLVVAGGGGGGGYGAGASGGDAGQAGHATGLGGRGGAAGGASAGGTGGAGAHGGECKGEGRSGRMGGEEQGGEGGDGDSEVLGELFPEYEPAGGGGGGGGYFGGGGGGGGAHNEHFAPESETCLDAGGGGGGSSFVAAGTLAAEATSEAARLTIGYEVLPAPAAAISVPAQAATYEQGQAVAASFACSDGAGAPGVAACEGSCWRFGAGGFTSIAIANGADIPTAEAGEYRCGLTARSTDGLSTLTPRVYTVVARRAAAPAPPVLAHVAQTRSRWREGGRLPALTPRGHAHFGTVFSFTLDQPAAVRFTFRRLAGRSRRFAGSITLHVGAGRSSLFFDGPLSRHARLARGTYEVTLSAVNARLEASQPHTLRFAIVG